MKKKVIFIFLLAIILSFIPFSFFEKASAEEEDKTLGESMDEILDSIDMTELEEYLSTLDFDLLEGKSVKEKILSLIGGGTPDYENLVNYILSIFFEAVESYFSVFLIIVCVCIFDGIINSVKGNLLSDGISDIVHYVCFATLLTLLLTCLIPTFVSVKDTVMNLKKQMEILFPILITLMSASGGTVSASIYQPSTAFLSNGIIQIVYNLIFPLVVLMIGLSVVGSVSGKINLSGFVKFFSSIVKWVMGIGITLYSVSLTVQGLTSASYDGISLKAIKYAVGSGIPIAGGFLSGGMDLMLAGSALIKNSVGIVALIILFFTISQPLILLISFSLLLKITSAVSSPVCDGRISSFLESLSGNVGYFTAGLLLVSFAYFVTVLLLICSSGVIF